MSDSCRLGYSIALKTAIQAAADDLWRAQAGGDEREIDMVGERYRALLDEYMRTFFPNRTEVTS